MTIFEHIFSALRLLRLTICYFQHLFGRVRMIHVNPRPAAGESVGFWPYSDLARRDVTVRSSGV